MLGGMTGDGPTGQQRPAAEEQGATRVAEPSPVAVRAARFNAANMARSLLPLVVIVLLVVGWNAFRQDGVDPVQTVDPSSTVQLAASRASYPLVVPTGLPKGYRPTSARTDAGRAREGDPVTLQIGYVTPSGRFAAFVESDDPRADALTAVLNGAQQRGTVDVGGASWTRSTTRRGETALSTRSGSLTGVVSGSASEKELAAMAGSVRPYSG
jgi:hypothetical protein